MKKALVFIAVATTWQGAYAQDPESKRLELERMEIETQDLERRLHELKVKERAQNNPNTSHNTPSNPMQDFLDSEMSRDIFGINRNGVLFGYGYSATNIEYGHDRERDSWISMLHLRLGYQRFPNNSVIGFRTYIDANIGFKNGKLSNFPQNIGAYNFDMLFDWRLPHTTSYFGVFAGLGYGIMQFHYTYDYVSNHTPYHKEAKLLLPMGFANFGVAITIGAKHRWELYVKSPFKNTHDENFKWYDLGFISLAYQYTF